MVATISGAPERIATGDLAIWEPPTTDTMTPLPSRDSPNGPAERLFATTTIRLGDLGAVTSGDPSSHDPAQPGGVLSGNGLTLGRCNLANPCDDGRFTYLTIGEVTDAGFAGWWTAVTTGTRPVRPFAQRPGGYFCAVRR